VLRFRNIEVSPDASVGDWGFEGILCALERGDLPDWQRIYAACKGDPSGAITQTVSEALDALEAGDIRPRLAAIFRRALSA
jgi:hypothetical protein